MSTLCTGLTEDETTIILMLCNGLNPKRISQETGIPLQTVKNNLSRVSNKTGIKGEINLLRHFHKVYGCLQCRS